MDQNLQKDLEELESMFDNLSKNILDVCDKYKKLVEYAKKNK